MWYKKKENLYKLDFNNLKNNLKNRNNKSLKIEIPDYKNNKKEYVIKRYSIFENNANNNVETYHSNDGKLSITLYDDHVRMFVFTDEENYSIKPSNSLETNIYSIKKFSNNKKNDKCSVKANTSLKKRQITDFVYPLELKKYNILIGIVQNQQNLFGTTNKLRLGRIIEILNLINLIYKNNFSCYFTFPSQALQETAMSNNTFVESSISSFTGIFNAITSNYDIGDDIGHVIG